MAAASTANPWYGADRSWLVRVHGGGMPDQPGLTSIQRVRTALVAVVFAGLAAAGFC